MLKLTNSRNTDTYVVFTDDDKIVGFKGNWYDAPLDKIVVYNYKGNAENYVKKNGGTIMKTSELIFKFDEYKRVHGDIEYNKRVHND